jgi:hypothetical protein
MKWWTWHRHRWKEIAKDGIGYFEKQAGQGSIIVIRGRIRGCDGCPELRLVPHDTRYRSVPCEPHKMPARFKGDWQDPKFRYA